MRRARLSTAPLLLFAQAASVLCACAPGSDAHTRWHGEAQRAAAAVPRGAPPHAWVRVTSDGLAAVPAIATIAAGDRRGGVDVPIPATRQGDLSVCPRGGCSIRVEPGPVRIAGVAGDVAIDVTASARTTTIPVRYEQRWPCAFTDVPACAIDVDTQRQGAPNIAARVRVGAAPSPASGAIVPRLVEASVPIGVDPGDLRIAGTNTCGGIWCTVANIAGATSTIARRADEALLGAVVSNIEALGCRPCALGCSAGTQCGEGSVCRAPSGACELAPLATRVSLGEVHGADSGALVVAVTALRAASHGSGVDVGLHVGASGDVGRCAPATPPPASDPLPASVLDATPIAGAHVRVAIGERALDRAMWAVHRAGAACVEASGADIEAVGAGAIELALPSARALAPLGVVSFGVAVRPLAAPRAHIGDDGSITVAADDVRIEVSAEVAGRRLRLAYATIDVEARATLSLAPGSLPALEIARGSFQARVDRVWSAAVLGAPEAELRRAFGALAALARAATPERVELPREAWPIPDDLALGARPRAVEVEGQRALVLDLRARVTP